MSEVIYDKGFEDGYSRAVEDNLREIQRFAEMGKSAQDCAELLEYLLTADERRTGTQ